MTLKVSLRCSGEIHVIEISAGDAYGFELQAEITHEGHDRECDEAAQEFGYQLPECYAYQKKVEKGFNELLLDDHLRHEFFKAVSEQPDGLGIDYGELAERIIESMERAAEEEDHDSALWILLKAKNLLPWFVGTAEFKKKSGVLARIAYDWCDSDFLSEILAMCSNGITIKVRRDFDDHGDGHAETSATFIVFIDDDEVDRWQAHYIGWYWDLESMEWHTERHGQNSTEPDDRTVEILEALGYKNLEEYEASELEPTEPDYPGDDGKGNWAVFLDDDLWGQYKREDSAQQTYDAMVDAEDFSGYSSGRCITLRHRSGSEEEWEEV